MGWVGSSSFQDFIDESVTSCISKKQAPPLPVVLSYAVLANSVEFLGVASLGKCLTDYGKELNETKLAIAWFITQNDCLRKC